MPSIRETVAEFKLLHDKLQGSPRRNARTALKPSLGVRQGGIIYNYKEKGLKEEVEEEEEEKVEKRGYGGRPQRGGATDRGGAAVARGRRRGGPGSAGRSGDRGQPRPRRRRQRRRPGRGGGGGRPWREAAAGRTPNAGFSCFWSLLR